MLSDNHLLAGLLRRFHLERRPALLFPALAALGAQGLQRPHAAFVAGATGLDALANPNFFLGQLLVEQRVGSFLGRHLLLLVHQKAGVVAVPVDQVATVQFQNPCGQVLQECTVVGDEQYGAVEAGQRLLEPGDGADVQVVGRLVQQQQVRLRNQRLGQQHASPPAAGQLGERLVGRQLQPAQGAVHQLLQAPTILGFERLLNVHELVQIGIVADVLAQVVVLGKQLPDPIQALGYHVEHGTIVGPGQFLWQFADLQSWRTPDFPVVGQLAALDQAQHAGLAGAITADDANPLASRNLPGHAIEQGMSAIGEGHIGQFEQGHGYLRETGRAF